VRTKSFLSRFAVKFVEVAGAGIASAACAYIFGQIERPQPPSAPVVQIAPASVERARMTQNDHPLVDETARTETENKPENVAATPTAVSAPKLAQPAQAALPRRNQNPSRARSRKRRRARGSRWRSRHPASHPILRLRRRGKVSKRQSGMAELWHRIAARRNGRCSRD
jgi:hypothetical protein